jgi:porin
MNSLIIISTFIFCLIPISLKAQQITENDPLLDFNASYIGDVVTNFSGGIKKGTRYLGLANFRLGLKTSSIGLWKGGEFFINGSNAHGGDPSSDLIGDFHIVSNIETDDITYVHELWYSQTFGNFEICAGLQDLNTEFVSTDNGSIFLNSTFGTPSTIASNVPSPIFPLTAVGVSLKVDFGRNSLKLAVFDGLPTSFTDNPHNLRWEIDSQEGIFAITEFVRTGNIGGLEGNFKGGFYYHSQLPESIRDQESTGIYSYNYGIYLLADQTIWKEAVGTREAAIFGQFAVSPERINAHHLYIGTGLALTGLLPGRSHDIFGIAYNRTFIADPSLDDESIVEISYKARLCESFFIQPDFQYVMNPGGTREVLKNAFVGSLRFGLNF